ncbi:MAG: zinc-binding protein [Myxococcales bacterium]|nr:zinc-binding protein [Myxococcales bacterium]
MSGGQDCCCATGVPTLIFACSGSSNVGQLTNSLALRLARESVGTMSCLAGVGAHLSGFVVPAKDCERLVVLDGCEHRCALKTLEHVEAKPHVYLNLAELGFVKKHGVLADEAELERAHALAIDRLKGFACSTAS